MAKLVYFLVILAIGLGSVAGKAQSSESSESSEEKGASDYPKCDKKKLQWFPHQLDCSLYYLCHHGNAILRSCAPGLFFNNSTGQCMLPEHVNCQLTCPREDDPREPLFLPDFNHCQNFYICYSGEAIHRTCAEGLLFDTENNWCNFEWLVDCGHRSGGGEGDGSVPLPPTTSTQPPEVPTTTQTPQEPPTTVTATTTNPDRFYDCPLEAGPFWYPHSINCSKYFECRNGIAYLMECSQPEEFDQVRLICKEDANCYSRNPTTIAP